MNKEKEIEELAKFMRFTACGKDKNCENEKCVMCFCPSKEDAELLYNAGYRKTFTSDLASDTQKAYKEGYNKGFYDRKALEEEYNKTHENYVAVLKHNAYLRNCLREEKKEAVKEFAGKVKDKSYVNNYCREVVEIEKIDELLKEFEK